MKRSLVVLALISGVACGGSDPPAPTPTLTANAGGPYQTRLGQDLVVSGASSTSSPRAIATFRWNCGQTTVENCSRDTATPTTTFRYRRSGTGPQDVHTLTLIVIDTAGNQSAPAIAQVTVLNQY